MKTAEGQVPDRRRQSIFWASTSLLSMMILLFTIAGLSGGFRGLSGTVMTIAYSAGVMTPLILIVYLAFRQSTSKTREPALETIAVQRKNSFDSAM